MKRIVIFMHCSLDGYVARTGGEMNWVRVDSEMFEYAGQRTEEADIALYGRVTYQMMDSYWPTAADNPGATKHDIEHSRWYNSVRKVVISKTMKNTGQTNTEFVGDNLVSEIRKRKEGNGKNIVLFGSPSVVRALMEAHLIDDYWLMVNPIILGKGIPLFKDLSESIDLKLAETKTFPSGVVCLHYVAKTN